MVGDCLEVSLLACHNAICSAAFDLLMIERYQREDRVFLETVVVVKEQGLFSDQVSYKRIAVFVSNAT